MIILGVTGKSGSGKSTVSTIIKNNTGCLVIDADILVKELRAPNENYYKEIVKLFGENILHKSGKNEGKINTKILAKEIFQDSNKREELNKLTFKYVGEKTKKIILENKDEDFIVLDFPLLYESGFDKICNYVIGVISDDETKIARLKERDKIHSREQIEARLKTQMEEEILKTKADYIIYNSSNVRYLNLVNNVIRIIHKIKKDEEEKRKNIK